MRFIIIEDNVVTSVRTGYIPVGDEIESELGEVGQVLQEDGTFITPEKEADEVIQETETERIEKKLDELKNKLSEDNIAQFEVLATIYETLLLSEMEEG